MLLSVALLVELFRYSVCAVTKLLQGYAVPPDHTASPADVEGLYPVICSTVCPAINPCAICMVHNLPWALPPIVDTLPAMYKGFNAVLAAAVADIFCMSGKVTLAVTVPLTGCVAGKLLTLTLPLTVALIFSNADNVFADKLTVPSVPMLTVP